MATVVADIHPVVAHLAKTRLIAVLVINDGRDLAALGDSGRRWWRRDVAVPRDPTMDQGVRRDGSRTG